YKCKGIDKDVNYIAELAKAKGASRIVIGLPINMDGTEGIRVQKSRDFADKLKAVTDIEIDYEDESLTTVAAEEVLIEQGMRWEERKKVIDKVAAAIILRCYLDRVCGK
ncbi:MAG: Holliday junction resolvase RuvX, partial [Clostridia bacterium]|nr:Holliday junction resolvase RuvX [Clostridia bacterium]